MQKKKSNLEEERYNKQILNQNRFNRVCFLFVTLVFIALMVWHDTDVEKEQNNLEVDQNDTMGENSD